MAGMNTKVRRVTPDEALWSSVAELFPRAVRWLKNPTEEGDYHFFAATDDGGTFLGGSVIEVGALRFGPLSEMPAGYIEDIHVIETYRRQGVGSTLLRATLDYAWSCGCETVRGTVVYDNTAGIALYRAMGLGFVPDEDPSQEEPERQYTVVALNPSRIQAGYGNEDR
jgi:ribosomal protein S18 acetylase RimI-like enzyme